MGRHISLHLEEHILSDLMRFTGEKRPSLAVRKAIDYLIEHERSLRIEELRQMLGKIDLEDNWYEVRHGTPRPEE